MHASHQKKHYAKDDVHSDAPSEQTITEGLAAIYGEERDDLSTMERAEPSATQWLVRAVISLAAVAIVAYASYFVYLKFFSGASQNPLTMTFNAPGEIVSGVATTITLHYANTARVPLAALAIDANLPDAFIVSHVTPTPTDADELVWNIGSVPQKGEGDIVFEGMWIASAPSTTTLQALATYRPANFNADFDEVATQSVTTSSSIITLKTEGPERTHPGEEATYVFTVENTGELPMTGVVFRLAPPSGFYVLSSTPVLEAGAAPLWKLGDIAPHAMSTVTVVGAFSADVVDVQQMSAAVTVKNGEKDFTQAESEVFTDVVGNGLTLQLVANGTNEVVRIDPGDPLRVAIGYTNTSSADMSNVAFLLDFQSTSGAVPISWHDATLDGGKLTQNGIAWDVKTIGTLGTNAKKTRNATFPTLSTLPTGSAETFAVVVHATVGGVTIQSTPITVSFNSDTAFSSSARYYTDDGAPVGQGPLPPRVGQQTTYRIVWSIENHLHALGDVRVSATLPPSVTWVGDARADIGTVAFDDATRTLSWTITDAAKDAGAIDATFSVAITPSASDVGTFIKLLSGSALRATDRVTNASLQLTADQLTTDLSSDAAAEGKGAVVE